MLYEISDGENEDAAILAPKIIHPCYFSPRYYSPRPRFSPDILHPGLGFTPDIFHPGYFVPRAIFLRIFAPAVFFVIIL